MRPNKKSQKFDSLRLAVALVALVFATSGCIQVVNFAPGSENAGGYFGSWNEQLLIPIEFNGPLDINSVNLANTQVDVWNGVGWEDIGFTWYLDTTNGNILWLATAATPAAVCVANPCDFLVYLTGTGTNPLRATNGEPIDGNRSGEPGGDYFSVFEVSQTPSGPVTGPVPIAPTPIQAPSSEPVRVTNWYSGSENTFGFYAEDDDSIDIPLVFSGPINESTAYGNVKLQVFNIDRRDWEEIPSIFYADYAVNSYWVSSQENVDYICAEFPCDFRLYIDGRGTDSLEGINGQVIDGDSNGIRGGDFTAIFTVQ